MTTTALANRLQITPSVVAALDAAIAQFVTRELVTGAEVVDLLLDIRLIAEADELVASR